MLDLYRNIKKYRQELKMSQAELAVLTGYTDRSSIAKIERGDVDLAQSKIMLFAKALHVDAGTLMGNTGILSRPLSQDEAILLDDYQLLNSAGKKKVREYANDLTEQDRYKKDTASAKKAIG